MLASFVFNRPPRATPSDTRRFDSLAYLDPALPGLPALLG